MVMNSRPLSNQVVKNASSAMPSDLKYENRWQVMNVFRDGREYTANDVAAQTGISRQTIMKAIRFFCDKGLLSSTGKGDSTTFGGKKPECFVFSAKVYLICITLWPDTINLTLLDIVRNRLNYAEHPMDTNRPLDELFSLLEAFVADFLKESGISLGDIYGVGLSVPGTVDYKTGALISNPYASAWAQGEPLASRLNQIFGDDVVVYVENAAKAVGRAVLLDAESIRQKRVMTLFSAWNFSACIIERGHVLNGKNSLIGEIGRMVLAPPDGQQPAPSLEDMLSIRHIRSRLRARPAPDGSPLARIPAEQITYQDLFAASAQDDPYANLVVEQLAGLIAQVIHNINFLVNPDVLIFHGELAYASPHFDKVFKERIRQLDQVLHQCTFETIYDKRSICELDALGLTTALTNFFFRDNKLYAG